MFLSPFFGRQKFSLSRRCSPGRRPLVEALEGRQLLSTFAVADDVTGTHALVVSRDHIGTDIVGNHIGTSLVQRKHVGTDIVGKHIGTSLVQRKHIGTDIVGKHIGTNVVDDAVLPKGGGARKH